MEGFSVGDGVLNRVKESEKKGGGSQQAEGFLVGGGVQSRIMGCQQQAEGIPPTNVAGNSLHHLPQLKK